MMYRDDDQGEETPEEKAIRLAAEREELAPEIAELLRGKLKNEQIARELGISEGKVRYVIYESFREAGKVKNNMGTH